MLPTSGSLSMGDINEELGFTRDTQNSLRELHDLAFGDGPPYSMSTFMAMNQEVYHLQQPQYHRDHIHMNWHIMHQSPNWHVSYWEEPHYTGRMMKI